MILESSELTLDLSSTEQGLDKPGDRAQPSLLLGLRQV